MRKKISVIGKGVEISQELSRFAEVGEDLRGADVVVLAGDGDFSEIARCAPASALVVAGDGVEERCREAIEATLFPRARIIGVADAAQVDAAVESIVLERDDPHNVVALKEGEFSLRSVRLGRGGIRELL
jgi:hypothetical protein